MLNDVFRSLIHVFTWLKERVVQLPKHLDITLVGLAQNAAHGIERLLSNHRDNRRVDRIIHDRWRCFVCLLKGWHPTGILGTTHSGPDFPASRTAPDLTR